MFKNYFHNFLLHMALTILGVVIAIFAHPILGAVILNAFAAGFNFCAALLSIHEYKETQ